MGFSRLTRGFFPRVFGLAALCAVLAVAAFPGADESLEQLIKRADSAPERERCSLYTEIAERQLHAADQLYNSGQNEAARAAVRDIVTYSEKASDAADRATLRLKHTEISLRKIAAKLRDIRRTVAFEEQKPIEDAADHLEKLRTDLLSRMFAKGGR
jgi:hypothetical protein